MDQDCKTYTRQHENFKKMLRKTANSRILNASQRFSMVLLWGQLHTDFSEVRQLISSVRTAR
jgi:hypothetical protein